MKKLLLIMTALVMLVSGVAAVSAYEAHLINVKAHVENALAVETAEINFGTVFPEEWLVAKREIKLSTSAVTELGTVVGDLLNVKFNLYAEWKPIANSNPVAFYNWMGYFTYYGYDVNDSAPQMVKVGEPPATKPGAIKVAGPYTLSDGNSHNLFVAIDVPVFEGFYNAITDALWQTEFSTLKPSGLAAPTWIVPANFPGFNPNGMDFGLDLKIQVVDINRVQPLPPGPL